MCESSKIAQTGTHYYQPALNKRRYSLPGENVVPDRQSPAARRGKTHAISSATSPQAPQLSRNGNTFGPLAGFCTALGEGHPGLRGYCRRSNFRCGLGRVHLMEVVAGAEVLTMVYLAGSINRDVVIAGVAASSALYICSTRSVDVFHISLLLSHVFLLN